MNYPELDPRLALYTATKECLERTEVGFHEQNTDNTYLWGNYVDVPLIPVLSFSDNDTRNIFKPKKSLITAIHKDGSDPSILYIDLTFLGENDNPYNTEIDLKDFSGMESGSLTDMHQIYLTPETLPMLACSERIIEKRSYGNSLANHLISLVSTDKVEILSPNRSASLMTTLNGISIDNIGINSFYRLPKKPN